MCIFPLVVYFRDYTVNVRAVDSGGLFCDITVTVHVMDVNQPMYITNLPKIVELNSQVFTSGNVVSHSFILMGLIYFLIMQSSHTVTISTSKP